MEFGISTQIHRRQPVTVDLLESIRKAGYERFELFCNRPHLDFHDPGLLRTVGRWFQENALPAPSIHLPFLENVGPKQKIWISPLDLERRHREFALDEIKRALELAERVTPPYVVMHLGNPGDAFSPVAFDYAYTAISQIREFAGVRVMIENIPNEISTIEYIHTTHVHDNHGEKDEHLWPFEGALDWPALIEKLVVAKYQGPFIFETRGGDPTKGADSRSRLRDLWDEAQNSIEEFRLKYKL